MSRPTPRITASQDPNGNLLATSCFHASDQTCKIAYIVLPNTILTLGLAQTIAWASTYYLPAMLATPMARDLNVMPATVFAAFSLALLVSAPLGPVSGRLIDRFGGRSVLMGSSVGFALGLVGLSLAHDTLTLFLAWAWMGAVMGCGLYDAAFAALARAQGFQARQAMGGITLVAGLASTVGWPLTAWMEFEWGWRQACWGWAWLHLAVGLPLNALMSNSKTLLATREVTSSPALQTPGHRVGSGPTPRDAGLLAFIFAASYFCSVAMAAHLPTLLQTVGVSWVAAVAAGALIGPAQVAGRVLELTVFKNGHPIRSAGWAAAGHPVGVLMLLGIGPTAAPLFTWLHGMGNGVMTIVRGTLPLALFGPEGYGQRQGWLVLPTRVLSALAPFLVGWALDAWGAATWWLTWSLSAAAMLALMVLRIAPHR